MWNAIPNLHIVGDIVEAVRIRCRYAVIVMIHCHLSFQQIMSSVECNKILGVLSLPCCNFFEVQKQFMGQDPTFEWFFSRFLICISAASCAISRFLHSLSIVTLPLSLGPTRLTSSTELAALPVGKQCTVKGEILTIRK